MPADHSAACARVWANFPRRSLHRLSRMQVERPFDPTAIDKKGDNQLIVAFWTCLQLERSGRPLTTRTDWIVLLTRTM